MKEVFGTFILSEDEGNYKGEFFNNHLDRFWAENIRIDNIKNQFEGTFKTDWEEKGQQVFADLRITLSGNLYNLNWSRVRNDGGQEQNVTFSGTGVVKEGRLVCVYKMRS